MFTGYPIIINMQIMYIILPNSLDDIFKQIIFFFLFNEQYCVNKI